MAGTDEGSPGGMRRWQKALLFGSLALNLAVAGLVAGSALREPDQRAWREGRDSVTPYTRAFTEEQRRDLGRALRAEFARGREGGRPDVLSGYLEAVAALRAEPFDPAALDAVLERQAGHAEMRRRTGQTVLRDYVAAMEPQDRAAFADRLETHLAEMAERRGPWRRD